MGSIQYLHANVLHFVYLPLDLHNRDRYTININPIKFAAHCIQKIEGFLLSYNDNDSYNPATFPKSFKRE